MSRGRGGSREVERRILRLLHGHKTRTKLREIHAHFLRHDLHQNNQVLSHFVSICANSSQMPYANTLFQQTQNPNIFLFNSVIKGYSLSGSSLESLCLYSVMRNRGIWPDEFTFVPLVKSCVNLCDVRFGLGVHGEVFGYGFERFGSVRVGIVEMYCKSGRMGDARKVFDEMFERGVIVWNLMVDGFCKSGQVDVGMEYFRRMGERSVVSWNSMLAGLALSGRSGEALRLFGEMREEGLEGDEATVVTMLTVCAHLGDDVVGGWIHSYARSSGLFGDSVRVGNSLVDFYCKRGDLDSAFVVFNEMPRKNVVSWNAMISGLAFNGNGERGVALFEEMVKEGVSPNDTTFVVVLSCCSHAGLIHKGGELLASMISDHNIEPKLEHYGCMVDLLGRSGCVKEAYDLIRTMPVKPNAVLWGSLLSACRNNNDTELAEVALKELINVEPWNSGNYVLLSNIYAEKGTWNEVENVRTLMKENCLIKEPGQSLVM